MNEIEKQTIRKVIEWLEEAKHTPMFKGKTKDDLELAMNLAINVVKSESQKLEILRLETEISKLRTSLEDIGSQE